MFRSPILLAALLAGSPALYVQAADCPAKKAQAVTAAKPTEMDIVDTAVAAGSFNTLAKALQAGGLVDALKGDGPFTVFAPTDQAFAKLPAGTLEALLQDKEKLRAVLTYHVVSGKVMAKDVAGIQTAKTLQGSELRVDAKDGVRINDASVIKADVPASNGVIHVIDTVLIPN